MRVVHVLGALVAGGAERFVSQLLPALRGQGLDASVALLSCRRDRAGEEMSRDLDAAGVAHPSGPTVLVRLRSVAWLRRELHWLRPDVVHLHNWNAEMAYLLATPGLGVRHRTVRTVHNTELAVPWLARLSLATHGDARTVFCGETACEHNRGRFPHAVAIPNGVRFDWAPGGGEASAAARARLGWSPGERHVVSIGRMAGRQRETAQKAHDVLIRAWKEHVADRSNSYLHLLGDGPLRAALEEQASGEPSIDFPGVCDDVRSWLQAADAFAMPSRWEGLPIAGLEAVGTGLPCVFSDIASLRELEPPVVAWCEPGNSESLVRALEEIAGLELPTAADVETFRSRYDIETCARRHIELYRELV